jgi:hypothetical protein
MSHLLTMTGQRLPCICELGSGYLNESCLIYQVGDWIMIPRIDICSTVFRKCSNKSPRLGDDFLPNLGYFKHNNIPEGGSSMSDNAILYKKLEPMLIAYIKAQFTPAQKSPRSLRICASWLPGSYPWRCYGDFSRRRGEGWLFD